MFRLYSAYVPFLAFDSRNCRKLLHEILCHLFLKKKKKEITYPSSRVLLHTFSSLIFRFSSIFLVMFCPDYPRGNFLFLNEWVSSREGT